MTRGSRLNVAGLLLRGLAWTPGASIVVAVIVACGAFVATATPRALDLLGSAEFQHSVTGVAPVQRDLVAAASGLPAMSSGASTIDERYAPMDSALAEIRRSFGEPLSSVVGPARYAMTTAAKNAIAAEPERDSPITRLAMLADPSSDEVLRMVEGAAAQPTGPNEQTTQFTLSTATADALRWSIGEARTIASAAGIPWSVVLVGTFEAVEPVDPYWTHLSSVLVPFTFDDGNATPIVTGTGVVHPLDAGVAERIMAAPTTTIWFPMGDLSSAAGDATVLTQQLRLATTGPRTLDVGVSLGAVSALTFSSGITEAIVAVFARTQATAALVAMVASGPFGVLLAVLALGARVVVQRRQPSLALLSARGASPWILRGLGALEGLGIGIPAAALGAAAALVAAPGAIQPRDLVLPIVVVLTPAVFLAASFPFVATTAARGGLDGIRPRFAWIAEVLAIGLAALAVVLLARRGLGAEGVGIDPLLSATPLLLAVATVVIVLRVYPVPLRAIEGVLRRRPGLTGFLGAARAVRQPAGGVAAVLALVVGISVAVFSSVMATTLERGVEAAARASVGADLQASGTIFGPSQLEQVRALPDIESMASLQDAARRSFTVDQVRGTVTLIIADVAELREVRPDFPLPADLTGEPDGAVPMLVSDDLAAELEPDAKLLLGSAPAEVVAVADRGDGVVAQSRWVLIDAAHAEDVTNSGFLPRILLIDLAADADTAAVAEAVAEIGGSTTTIREPAQAARDIRAAPAVSGLQTALVLAMALVALLAAIAVVMASVVGASARGRMLALLSTLGLSRREAGGLAAWELAPVAITATVVGTALGLALPWLVVAGLDLRPFTGGSVQPAIAVDVFAVLGLVGVFAAVVAAAVLAGLVIGQRTDAAAALRMGEEG